MSFGFTAPIIWNYTGLETGGVYPVQVPRKSGKARHHTPEELNLEALARGFTKQSIKRLGGFITADDVEPSIAIRAIELMLDRGHGRPASTTKHEGTAPDGSHVFVVRHIYVGKPKGEK